jgi:polar amino acid transport system permease protein
MELVETHWVYLLVGQYPNGPVGGLALTLALAGAGLVLALPLGLALGLARVSPSAVLSGGVGAFVALVRGVPLLLVVFWAYFFLPTVTGVEASAFGTMLGALVVFDAAYLAEIVRGAIEAVPRGQLEAARALGLGRAAAMRAVVLPQALQHALPSIVNQLVATVKATSLGYVIGLSEVSFVASQINTQVMTKPAEVYGLLALTYLVLCGGLSSLARAVERATSAPAGAAPRGGWAA